MVYNVTNSFDGEGSVVTIFDDDGGVHTFSSGSPIFEDIVSSLTQENFGRVRFLVRRGERIKNEFLSLSDELSIRGNDVYFGDQKLYGKLTQTVIDFYDNGWDMSYLVKFIKKIMSNPSFNSREQLYDFLDLYDFVINEDGNFIAYKGVNKNFTSVHAGYGVVDGFEYEFDHLPNGVGSVVSIPRSLVDDNVNHGCSYGLHVGSWDYATKFSKGATLTVEVNPANVVSVPHDVSHQKIRVSEYKVLDRAEHELSQGEVFVDVKENMLYEMKTYVDNHFNLADFVSSSYNEIYSWVVGSYSFTDEEKFVLDELNEMQNTKNIFGYHVNNLMNLI